MIKFNLKDALNGKQLITRNGLLVTDFKKYNHKYVSPYEYQGIINGEIEFFMHDGKFLSTGMSHKYDLFLDENLKLENPKLKLVK